ncbi:MULTISPECIES: LysR family transcriptional regulator [unclassified Sporosarcina]|uniref:LysR family transcriptional regulator n=1 Tax=unclassified Sporosarcina TaxID=2647733 RepID=UPI00203C53F9|nr:MULTISPECIES: LysR family transcriptional regulator [unclassified Sporosarcina]GKV67443.1 putative HTH-type transcriptional regulator YkuM [Sporosarcina sp. NCCP-2331]GLB57804.1 putative HTH-type transcriptional regulator YkuM [Sporosarcina sp. NCCP-2378]
MNERDWLVLQTLYEEKNITKAAQRLYISQPALTNRLQVLEREFGVQIVNRGRRGIQFTPQGEYLAKSARDMLLRIQSIKENVINMEENLTGTLRLGVSTFFTDYMLPNLLKLFKDQYPDVEFKVTTNLSSQIAHLTYNQDVHIGIVKGDFSWKDEKHLLMEETICIASKEKIDMENLPNLPRIDYHTDALLKNSLDNWWTERFAQPPLVSIEVDKADTCKKMVMNGLGYAILPRLILDDVPELEKVDIYTLDGKPIVRRTWMLYHKESLHLNIVKAFVQFLEEEFRK